MKIFNPKIWLLTLLISAGMVFLTTGCGQGKTQRAVTSEKVIYHCPMHPAFTADKPGSCPICVMNLVKIDDPASIKTPSPDVPALSLSKQHIHQMTVKWDDELTGKNCDYHFNTYYCDEIMAAKEILATNPNNSEALVKMATAYSMLDEKIKAINLMNKALSITPNSAEVLLHRGEVYSLSGSYDLAIADYTKAMELKAGDKNFVALCYMRRSSTYMQWEKYSQSFDDVRKAMEMGYKVEPSYLSVFEEKGIKVGR